MINESAWKPGIRKVLEDRRRGEPELSQPSGTDNLFRVIAERQQREQRAAEAEPRDLTQYDRLPTAGGEDAARATVREHLRRAHEHEAIARRYADECMKRYGVDLSAALDD